MISTLVCVSRLPVGSSASSTEGRLTRARAIATRCCWPPESWLGMLVLAAARPDGGQRRRRRARCCSCERHVAVEQRQLDVLERVVRGSRLKLWKTKPSGGCGSRRARRADRRRHVDAGEAGSVPRVGRSRQPRMFMKVDLPEPEAPMTATNSPAAMSQRRRRAAPAPRRRRARRPSTGRARADQRLRVACHSVTAAMPTRKATGASRRWRAAARAEGESPGSSPSCRSPATSSAYWSLRSPGLHRDPRSLAVRLHAPRRCWRCSRGRGSGGAGLGLGIESAARAADRRSTSSRSAVVIGHGRRHAGLELQVRIVDRRSRRRR